MKDKKVLNTRPEENFFDMADLRTELTEENNFLIKLVDTIPPKMYFEQDIKEKITAEKHIAMDKFAEGIKRKSSNHNQLSVKHKHKRARLDPLYKKSISQIHDELSKKKINKKKRKGVLVPSASLTRAANIEELQKRLQEKIHLFQEKRKASRNNPKQMKKIKSRVKKLKKQKGNLIKVAETDKSDKPAKKNKKDKTNDKSNDKPVFNKESNLIYSKFDFSENGFQEPKKSEYTGRTTKALLEKAEKKKEKLENLKIVNPEKAELVTEKEKWKKAIQKVEGVKVRDDPKLLKKTLKREEKKKKKSGKVWKQRVEDTEKRKNVRQEKRDRNIKQKKQEKLDRKLKSARKKGRGISF